MNTATQREPTLRTPQACARAPARLDVPLARLAVEDRAEIDWSLVGLLTPFNGIAVERPTPTVATPGGRTLASAILNARAHGPRNTLG
jgi:hypothetical protein